MNMNNKRHYFKVITWLVYVYWNYFSSRLSLIMSLTQCKFRISSLLHFLLITCGKKLDFIHLGTTNRLQSFHLWVSIF